MPPDFSRSPKGTLLYELISVTLQDAEVFHAQLVIERVCACSNDEYGLGPCERQRRILRLRDYLTEVMTEPSPRARADFPSTKAERTWELGIEVYGPEVLHLQPTVILSVPSGQLVLADPFDALAETFTTVVRRIEARRDE